jgi:hypothetical protein
LVLRVAFFVSEPFPTLQEGFFALLAKSKIANSRLFNTFHKHAFVPHVLVARFRCIIAHPLPSRHLQRIDPPNHAPEQR